jgi:thiol-disulfide isomerase/thioredoxin
MKNQYCTVLFLFLALCYSGASSGQDNRENTIELYFDKIVNLSTVRLAILLQDKTEKLSKLRFDGYSKDGHTWLFHYPDSIYGRISSMSLAEPMQNDTIEKSVGFVKIHNGDTIKAAGVLFAQGTLTPTKLRYIQTRIFPNILYMNKRTNKPCFKKVFQDTYMVEDTADKDADKELEASINSMYYGYSMFARTPYMRNEDYASQLKRYISLTKDYPDSQSLMASLSSTLTFYRSRRDIEKIFRHFSEAQQNSYFGKKVRKYLTTIHFENSLLPSSKTGKLEPIVEDTTKFTLVVFSASWCVPCHKLIPLLKEIYRNSQTKLNMVYVSMDKPETGENWKALLKKEEIPWRSVLAADKTNEVEQKYTVQTIPLELLIEPDGTYEPIDLYRQSDLDKLCNMLRIANMKISDK